jgi:maltose O-acetyltransferase
VSTSTQHRSTRDLGEIASIVRSYARARLELRGTKRGARIRCHGRVIVPRRGAVTVGQRAVFLGGSIPIELRCEEGAELSIGDLALVNYGVSIVARRRIQIGARCLIASLVHIRDDDGRRTAPVVIGDDVWIAYGAVIEPGTTIGDGSVIGTMAVVSGDVPPRSLAAGNPARFFPLGGAEADAELVEITATGPALGPATPSASARAGPTGSA